MSHLPADQSRLDDEHPGSAEGEEGNAAAAGSRGMSEPDFFEEEPDAPAQDESVAAAPESPDVDTATAAARPQNVDAADERESPADAVPPPAQDVSPPSEPDQDVTPPLAVAPSPETPRVTCAVCGNETEALAFCGHCASSLVDRLKAGEERAGRLRRAGLRVRSAVLPSAGPVASGWQATALIVLAGLAVIALLVDNVGVALMLGAALIPLLLATTMPRLDLYGRESPVLLLLAAVGGAVAGVVVGAAMAWTADRWWFETGQLRYGAAGYGGDFAAAEGSAPLTVLILNGVVLPVLALALALGIAYALRRWHQMRNEAMDGMTLGAIAGAGWAVGAAVVFAWPIATAPGPAMSVPDWTLLTLGLTLFRPIILTGATAIVGTAVWQSLLGRQRGAPLVMALVGIASVLLLGIGTIVFQPRDLQIEVLWNFAVAVVVMVALRLSLRSALAFDRRSLSGEHTPNTSRGPRPITPTGGLSRPSANVGALVAPATNADAGRQDLTTCPHCGKTTPPGTYCANCGRPLSSQESGVRSRE